MKKIQCLLTSALVLVMALPPLPAYALAEKMTPPAGSKIVYHIQDAHDSFSAQKQIAIKIRELQKQHHISTIIYEGAPEGWITGADFKEGASNEVLARAADDFLSKGHLNAAEYAYLTAEDGEPLLYGVENPEFYREDLKHFRALLNSRQKTFKIVNNIARIINNPHERWARFEEKKKVDQWISRLDEAHLDLVLWINYMGPLIRAERIHLKHYPNYRHLCNLIDTQALSQKLKSDEAKKEFEKLRGKELFAELAELGWVLREKMADTAEEKAWVRFKHEWAFVKKFCLGEIAPNQLSQLREMGGFETLRQSVDQFKRLFQNDDVLELEKLLKLLEPINQEADQFYLWAGMRSQAMGENVLKYFQSTDHDAVILVTGGFHVMDLERYFKDLNVRCYSWQPAIPETDEKRPYFERMKEAGHSGSAAASGISSDSFFEPITGGPDECGRRLAAFREATGVTPEKLSQIRELAWSQGKSLGVESAVKTPASLEAVFSGLITGKSFLDPKGNPNFRVIVPGRHYALNRPVLEVIKDLFANKSVGAAVAERYRKDVLKLLSRGTEEQELHVDWLLWVLANFIRDYEGVSLESFLAKKRILNEALDEHSKVAISGVGGEIILAGFDSAGKFKFCGMPIFWGEFFDNRLLSRLFQEEIGIKVFDPNLLILDVPAGKNLKDAIREAEERYKGDAIYRGTNNFDKKLSLTLDQIYTNKKISPEDVRSKLNALEAIIREVETAAKVLELYRERSRLIGQIRAELDEPGTLVTPREKRKEKWQKDKENLAGRFTTPANAIIVQALLQWKEIPDALDLLLEWKNRFRNNISFPAGEMEGVLKSLRRGESARMGERFNPAKNNSWQNFLFSEAASIFDSDSSGHITHPEKVLAAFLAYCVDGTVEQLKRLKKIPEEKAEAYLLQTLSAIFSAPTDKAPQDLLVEQAWNLYYPETKALAAIFGKSETRWLFTLAVGGEGEIEGLLLSRAHAQIFGPKGNRQQLYDYIVLAPGKAMEVNPFLFLHNKTDRTVLFRLENPGTSSEKAVVVENLGEKKMVAGWVIARARETANFDKKVYQSNGELSFNQNKVSTPADPEKEILPLVLDMARLAPAVMFEDELIDDRSGQKERIKKKFFDVEPPNFSEKVKGLAVENIPEQDRRKGAIHPKYLGVGVENALGSEVIFRPFSITLDIPPGEKSGDKADTKSAIKGIMGRRIYGASTLLRVPEADLWRIVSAYRFLRQQNLEGDYKEILDYWEGPVLSLWSKAAGKSLGVSLAADVKTPIPGPIILSDLIQTERELKLLLNQNGKNALAGLSENAEGPYELFVFWDALRRGVLLKDHLPLLFEKIPQLKITVIDDALKGEDIKRRINKISDHSLGKYITSGQLVIPSNPRLEDTLKDARERLGKVYRSNFGSFLGVVYSDRDGQGRSMSAGEMVSRAPHVRRFVVQGKINLEIIPRAVFALVDGNPRDYFNQTFQGEDIWTETPLSIQSLLGFLSSSHQGALQLQMSA
ncbi:MAG: hypothetical protein HZC17_02950 [Candidatus Omnitrophica bacterium]|nr:hypothetical protein [Candidatus Omnitrophota bacterium]